MKATIATEDANFYENNGLNIRGLIRAGVENLSPFGDSNFLEGTGGSSITQQLAKNVYIPKEERGDRSVDRKLKEAAIAIELTDRYTKDQILEWYLNSISYGGIYVGIETAAQRYFGKPRRSSASRRRRYSRASPRRPRSTTRSRTRPSRWRASRRSSTSWCGTARSPRAQAEQARRVELVFKANRFEIEAPHFVLGRVAREIEQRFGERALYEDGLES